jgi:hypothetical protein
MAALYECGETAAPVPRNVISTTVTLTGTAIRFAGPHVQIDRVAGFPHV